MKKNIIMLFLKYIFITHNRDAKDNCVKYKLEYSNHFHLRYKVY